MVERNRNDVGQSKKRQLSMQDYFSAGTPTSTKRPCQYLRSSPEARYDSNIQAVPGLTIFPSFVSEQEERNVIQFLDSQNWRTDLARRVIHYGGTFCLMPPRDATAEEKKRIESTTYKAAPIPDELNFILDRMVFQDIYTTAQRPEYCIVNSYTENQGISAHVENFRFASPVCGLTLLNGDWMRFHELTRPDDGSVRSGKAAKAVRTGRKIDVWMPRRSLLVMSGEAREKWQHEIVRSRKDRAGVSWRRVSLTFRTLKQRMFDPKTIWKP